MREFHVIMIDGQAFELVTQGEDFARKRCAALNAAARKHRNILDMAGGENYIYTKPARFSYVSDGGSARRLRNIIEGVKNA